MKITITTSETKNKTFLSVKIKDKTIFKEEFWKINSVTIDNVKWEERLKKDWSEVEELFIYFLDRFNDEIIKKDIREQRFVGQNRFKMWFETILPLLSEYSENQWYKLLLPKELNRIRKNRWENIWRAEYYRLIKI